MQDGTHFSPKEQTSAGDFKYITAKNIKHWGLDLSDVTYLPEAVHREIFKRCNPEKGDVLYIKDGVTTGVATVNSLDEEFSLLSSVALLKPKRDLLDPRFLKYYLNSPDGYRSMTGQMTGTAIKRLILRRIKESLVPVAPLDEQREIVAEVEKQFTRLEAGVVGLRRVQANLKRYHAAVLKAACEGKLVPTEAELARQEGRSYETGAQLLERILAERRQKWSGKGKYKEPEKLEMSKLPELPEGWTWVSWETVLASGDGAFKRGPFGSALKKSIFVEKGFKVYEQYCPINDDCSFGRYYISPEKFNELRAFEVKAGDYLISCSGVTLGRKTRVPSEFERGIINQALLRVRINETVISPRYFLRLFRSSLFQERLFDASTGSAIPNVKGVKDLKALPIPLPSLHEQQRIVAEVERRLSVVEELESVVNANLQRASRLRQSILQRAFFGQLCLR